MRKNFSNRLKITGIIKEISMLIVLTFLQIQLLSQNSHEKYRVTRDDSLALEKIIVEKYYISHSTDWADTSKYPLREGSVTYRIFVDMKEGYNLQMVYGSQNHELVMETTTTFYNDLICYGRTGFNIDPKKLHIGNVALDSWITMGAATRQHTGILLSEDTDEYSFLINRPAFAKVDGLTKGILPNFKIFNIDLNFFNNDSTASRFSTTDGGWAALGGVKGPTVENRVLIAQLTTDGELSFELNVQIGTPSGGFVQFVAKNPAEPEIQFDGLIYNR